MGFGLNRELKSSCIDLGLLSVAAGCNGDIPSSVCLRAASRAVILELEWNWKMQLNGWLEGGGFTCDFVLLSP